MRETEKKKIQNNNQTKRAARTPRKDNKSLEQNGRKLSNAKETSSKVSNIKPASTNSISSDANIGTEPSEVYEDVVIHYMDDAYRSEDPNQRVKDHDTTVEGKDGDLSDHHIQQAKEEDSDFESAKDSSSSQGDSQTADDEKVEKVPRVSKKTSMKGSHEQSLRGSRARRDQDKGKSGVKQSHSTPKKPMKANNAKIPGKDSSDNNNANSHYPSSESSEGIEDQPVEDVNQEMFDEASNGAKATVNETESAHAEDNDAEQGTAALKGKIEIMESRIERLEEELREVAALEISLYSVTPEHGSSAHKVHTPARRLSRLYIHACKHWTQSRRATIARNTVSGLILVARTCGNDVSRLTFWLSNTVVLRELISQAFGLSHQPITARFRELNGSGKAGDRNMLSVKLKGNSGDKQVNRITQVFEDWHDTSTFTAALEKIESWIFSRVVESVWWQALTPNMLSPLEDLISQKSIGKLLGPALGDQQQGTFSIELWKNAFQGAFQRLCPVRAAGHECGCLPVLARMVMGQCIARLDVAMFNAILRESAHQIPTDPVSDPIVDSRVLPIPAGDFSFGSGAQLKNSVGNWSRWFAAALGMETDRSPKDLDDSESRDDNHQERHGKTKCFRLLNELSELLMLPKDMLMDRSIRKEVCPSISLALIKRILCYFTPDEFCPDAVSGEVLEALNAESVVERRLAGESSVSFPYPAEAVVYSPPSSEDVSEKVADAGGKAAQLERNASMIQKKGYTSDEELDDLDSPFSTLIEPSSPSTFSNGKEGLKFKGQTSCGGNARYELLREVWSL